MRNPFASRPALTSEQESDLRAFAEAAIRPGFTRADEARLRLVDFYEQEGLEPQTLRREASRIVDDAWATRHAQQAAWTDQGDYDRLAETFGDLEGEGILGRMNFSCCQNCATLEIDDERTAVDAPAGEYPWKEWAYTLFHEQDCERLAESPAILHLTYSAFRAAPDCDPADVAAARAGDADAGERVHQHTDGLVAASVVGALQAHGLRATWSGDTGERIAVHVTDWRKRLPTG